MITYLFVYLFTFNVNADEALPALKGKGIKVWDQKIESILSGDITSFNKVLIYPSSTVLKGVQAYDYRKYLIKIFNSTPEFYISNAMKLFNNNPHCILNWLFFHKEDRLMPKVVFFNKISTLNISTKNKLTKLANKFYENKDFVFDSKGCRNVSSNFLPVAPI